MKEDKLIFRVMAAPIGGKNMRISPKTRNYINQIRSETGLSAIKIVEMCMAFAVKNYEVEEF